MFFGSSTRPPPAAAFPRPRGRRLTVAALLCFALSASAAEPAAGFRALASKPLYEFSEAEVGAYLAELRREIPDLRKRIVHLARKNIGQPYEIYLLGEMPFETHDPQPLYSLGKSDCVVFVEHTLAMALTTDWAGFMRLLQRIRYRDGQIGVATRNHFTEADWNPSNRWLVRDITEELAGGKAVTWTARIDRAGFLRRRYHLEDQTMPVEEHRNSYLPYAEVARADPHLREGDLINVVRGIVKPGEPENETFGGNAWIGHLGFVTRGEDGTLHILHSAEPAVREEPLSEFIARATADLAERDAAGKQRLLGFKFLRLEEDPWANLRALDGAEAPRVRLPSGLEAGL